jgi:hypothetical protein
MLINTYAELMSNRTHTICRENVATINPRGRIISIDKLEWETC